MRFISWLLWGSSAGYREVHQLVTVRFFNCYCEVHQLVTVTLFSWLQWGSSAVTVRFFNWLQWGSSAGYNEVLQLFIPWGSSATYREVYQLSPWGSAAKILEVSHMKTQIHQISSLKLRSEKTRGRGIEPTLYTYQPNAVPLGQTGRRVEEAKLRSLSVCWKCSCRRFPWCRSQWSRFA